MTKEFSTISELRSIRERKSRLSERERELTESSLDDLNIISELYNHYSSYRKCPNERRASGRYRQCFLFCVLFLYSPSTLAGGQMKNGLREELSRAMGLHNPTKVSQLCVNLTFNYDNYKDFREEVDNDYQKLTSWLKAKELIK